jgi:hypothetical protein
MPKSGAEMFSSIFAALNQGVQKSQLQSTCKVKPKHEARTLHDFPTEAHKVTKGLQKKCKSH